MQKKLLLPLSANFFVLNFWEHFCQNPKYVRNCCSEGVNCPVKSFFSQKKVNSFMKPFFKLRIIFDYTISTMISQQLCSFVI